MGASPCPALSPPDSRGRSSHRPARRRKQISSICRSEPRTQNHAPRGVHRQSPPASPLVKASRSRGSLRSTSRLSAQGLDRGVLLAAPGVKGSCERLCSSTVFKYHGNCINVRITTYLHECRVTQSTAVHQILLCITPSRCAFQRQLCGQGSRRAVRGWTVATDAWCGAV